MSNLGISYLNRNFDDYKKALQEYVKRYYPQIANDFNDASIGSWLIELAAAIGDNLGYYIDKTYAETNIESAEQRSSIYDIARNYGLKVPGPKASVAEVEFTCVLPASSENGNSSSTLPVPAMELAPVIKKGTKVSTRSQVFEVMEDVDFSKEINSYGVGDRIIEPIPSTGKYKITKNKVVVSAGESKVYKQVISSNDIVPFMELVLPDTDVMCVESIIFKEGDDFKSDPSVSEFMTPLEINNDNGKVTYRFFEVDSLAEQYRWGDDVDTNVEGNQANPPAKEYMYGFYDDITGKYVPVTSITKGKWVPLTQKFITEFTDNGYIKIIFGSGEEAGTTGYDNDSDFAKYQISRMVRNNFLGVLPPANSTMYVLYRVGGGAASNVAAGTITNISYLNIEIGNGDYACSREMREKMADVKNSITVTNPNPSVSGKDAPTVDEIRNMIKYNSAAQERCVTVKDYENRIAKLPPRYGSPFRVSVIEENNKVKVFMLGLDHNGRLSAIFPEMLIRNITEYLSKYRSINDYVSIEAGEIIHLSFEVEIFVDKNYNSADVAYNVINTIKDYMDVNKHQLGEDIFVGDIERQVSSVDGVLNLIKMEVYNLYSDGSVNPDYSSSRIAQNVTEESAGRSKVLLEDTYYVLNSNVDSMFEILNPENDIKVKMIAR